MIIMQVMANTKLNHHKKIQHKYIIHEFASNKADLYLPLKYSPENVCVTHVYVLTYILNTQSAFKQH